MSGAAKTATTSQQGRPVAGLGDGAGYGGSQTGQRAVSGLPRPSGEARARAELKAAQERLGHLVDNLATAERAANRASELAWDRERDIEAREAAAKKRRQGGLSDGDEKALVDSILGGVALVEEKEAPDPDLERLKKEAEALRSAATRLKARLPDRRDQIPYCEDAVKAATKVVVGSSAVVATLLEEAEVLSLQLIRRKAILAGIIDHLPSDSAELARASALLQPTVFPARHPEAEMFRAACERLSVDASAPLPEIGQKEQHVAPFQGGSLR